MISGDFRAIEHHLGSILKEIWKLMDTLYEEIFSYRVAAFSYRTVVEHAVVVRIFALVSSSAPIVKRSMK